MAHSQRRNRRSFGFVTNVAVALITFVSAFSGQAALADTGQYQFWSTGQSLSSSSVYVIVKGPSNPSGSAGQTLVNYEQSFILNATEASYARSQGWLAHTCSGAEIHPLNGSGTLLDAANAGAVDWRSSSVAAETNAKNRQGTFLDTLRPIFPTSFYDGVPCDIEQDHSVGEAAWRVGSIDLVTEVRSKTGGKMIIANGSGMQSGKSYSANQAAVDDFLALARPEGVQIEQFGRKRNLTLDADFMRSLGARGIIAFAKCDGTKANCRTAFNNGLNGSAYMTIPLV